jgi:RecA-family ATPase
MDGHVTLLTGRPGEGKSLLALQWAVAVATGRQWLHWRPRAQRNVLMLSIEDDLDEQHRRLIGVCRGMRVSAPELQGHLFKVRGVGAALVSKGMQGTPQCTRFYHELSAVRSERFGLIVVDPLVSTHEGCNENDNADMQKLAAALRDLSRIAPACPVLVVHHTRKGSVAADPDSGRGASAVLGVSRIQIGLDRMSDKEAKDLLEARDFAQRWRYAKVSTGKSNYGARGGEQWLQMAIHPLAHGDEAPAWDEWAPDIDVDTSLVGSKATSPRNR